jgi:hypothetical protein
MSMADDMEHSNITPAIFDRSAMEQVVRHCLGRTTLFLAFLDSTCRVLPSLGPTENSINFSQSFCQVEAAHNKRLLRIRPHIQRLNMIFFECIAAFELIKDGSFYFLQDVFHFVLLFTIQFSLPVMTLFKNGSFLCVFAEKNWESIIILVYLT